MRDPYIIAEVGSNCFKYPSLSQNLTCAKEQIEGAKRAGADAVKFQMFTARELWGPSAVRKTFSKVQDQYAVPEGWLAELRLHCRRQKIDFLCSAFSPDGFRKVDLYVKYHKVASPEVPDPEIAETVEELRKPVIWSLGCTTPESIAGEDVLLECVSAYPADPLHYDLYATMSLASGYDCRWGISDHTKGAMLARLARSLGASVFEKHVDFSVYGGRTTPDSQVSITGEAFRMYVNDIRTQEVVNHDEHKSLAMRLYGRRETKDGWFRPWPEGAPGAEKRSHEK
jgi:sialic acid synthase SpsE